MSRCSNILILCVLVTVAVNCNPKQEFINGIRNIRGSAFNGGQDILSDFSEDAKTVGFNLYDRELDTALRYILQKDGIAKDLELYTVSMLKNLRFGSKIIRIMELPFVSNTYGSVKFGAFLGYKEGSKYIAFGGEGKGQAKVNMNGGTLTPTAIDSIFKTLFYRAAVVLYDKMSRATGLGASYNLGSSYISYSKSLRRLYGSVKFDESKLDNVPSNLVGEAIKSLVSDHISKTGVLTKIISISKSANKASFLHAPTSTKLCLVSCQKLSNGYSIQISIFQTPAKLPNGAFATSTGSWKIEAAGSSSNPSIQQLLKVFPALK